MTFSHLIRVWDSDNSIKKTKTTGLLCEHFFPPFFPQNDYGDKIQPVNSSLTVLQAVVWPVQVLLVHLSKIIHSIEVNPATLKWLQKFWFTPSFFFFSYLLLCYSGTERRVAALWNHVRRAIIHHKRPTEQKITHRLPRTTEAFVWPIVKRHSAEILLIIACFSRELSAFIKSTLFSSASKPGPLRRIVGNFSTSSFRFWLALSPPDLSHVQRSINSSSRALLLMKRSLLFLTFAWEWRHRCHVTFGPKQSSVIITLNWHLGCLNLVDPGLAANVKFLSCWPHNDRVLQQVFFFLTVPASLDVDLSEVGSRRSVAEVLNHALRVVDTKHVTARIPAAKAFLTFNTAWLI